MKETSSLTEALTSHPCFHFFGKNLDDCALLNTRTKHTGQMSQNLGKQSQARSGRIMMPIHNKQKYQSTIGSIWYL